MEIADRVAVLERRNRSAENALRRWRAAGLGVAVLLLLVAQSRPGDAQGSGNLVQRIEAIEAALAAEQSARIADVAALNTKVTALQGQLNAATAKLAPLTTVPRNVNDPGAGYDMYLDGANLHVRNGTGATNNPNALGNLIIGYNESRAGVDWALVNGPDQRTGSHNLILGIHQNYTSAQAIMTGVANGSSALGSLMTGANNRATEWGAVVFGDNNTVSATLASVLGGYGNTASGSHGAVLGGAGNTVSGQTATVGGGQANVSSGLFTVVSGGGFNVSAAHGGTISGGLDNRTLLGPAQDWMTVSGGFQNHASGWASTVGGGANLIETRGVGWSAGRSGGAVTSVAHLFRTPD